MHFWSQTSVLAVAIVATVVLLSPLWLRGAVREPSGVLDALRGAATTYVLITLVLFATLLGGGYGSTSSLWMHLLVPLAALADWLLLGTGPRRMPVWVPVTWMVIPLVYLPFYISASERRPLYRFLDPDAGDFLTWVVMLFLAFLVAGYLVWGAGRLRLGTGRSTPATPRQTVRS
ncbi:hypothetical protein GIS00_07440 [Nakamurella sp. YIM 132087]|uniref:Integral membrane protein n=1 Tax=Nakamurella alba TaxID=2665158 RepID=A0A7K1FI77_9ACTN|nr:hypothetical protein [Nakamurella alba]MTD13776.1 hypothetical protein [Nakamurella alba]